MNNFLNSLLGDSHEISESLNKALDERLSSPFYGFFILAWLSVNWQIPYTALFQDQELLLIEKGLLRAEYISSELIPSTLSLEWIFYFFILPFWITIIVFWPMQYVTRFFYRKYIKNVNHLEVIRIKETTEKIKAEKEEFDEVAARADAKKEAEEKSPEILWEEEYREIKKTKHFRDDFWIIKDLVMDYAGDMEFLDNVVRGSNKAVKIVKDYIFLLAAKGVLRQSGSSISLTKKGTYIVGRFIEDTQNKNFAEHKLRTGF
tara:strand:- start:4572 stop:5354 length:783 start_codon:yes stop_codon:yes gene_type:complete